MPTVHHDGGAQAYVTGTLRSDISSSSPNTTTTTATTIINPTSVPITALKLSTAIISLAASTLNSSSSSSSSTSPTSSSSSCSSTGSTPPPAYTSIDPTSTSPRSPVTALRSPSILSTRSTSTFLNPLQAALNSPSKPIKPLLTARSSNDSISSSINEIPVQAINVFSTVFSSSSPVHSLPSSTVDLGSFSTAWKGAVLENEEMGTRTLYVVGGSYKDVNMRESVCGVMEKAEDELACTGVVMCLEKNSSDLGELIHQLLYVGGTITNQPFASKSSYILVGLDI